MNRPEYLDRALGNHRRPTLATQATSTQHVSCPNPVKVMALDGRRLCGACLKPPAVVAFYTAEGSCDGWEKESK